MKREKFHRISFLLLILPALVYGQQAEYNMSSYWVYPAAEKYIKISFVNMPNGELINNGYIGYDGDFTNNGKVNFTTTKACGPGLSEFSGSSLQHISGSGDTTRFYNLKFNHQLVAGAVSLEQTIAVAHQVDFSTGIVTASQPMCILSLEANAQAINASDRSYMNGFVSKTGNSKFSFPVGDGGYYRPITIEPQGLVSECFTARYVFANPETAGYTRNNKDATLASISDKEYWVLNHSNGTDKGQVTLSWDVTKTSAPVLTNLNTLAVVRWNGSSWVNEGNAQTTGDNTAGTITANTTGYGVFTLANVVVKAPIANDDNLSTQEDTPIKGNVLTNDVCFAGTALTVKNISINNVIYKPGSDVVLPQIGTLTMATNGEFTFTPALNYNGVVNINYTANDINGNTATAQLSITVVGMPEVIKKAGKLIVNNVGIYSWVYTISIQNDTPNALDNVQLEDNLDDVFKGHNCDYTVTRISATGHLVANGLYNGSSNTKTLIDGLSLPANKLDTVLVEVRVNTHNQLDIVTSNQAVFTAKTDSREINLKSDADATTSIMEPTLTKIPVINVFLPDGFSPNNDGINDVYVIKHPLEARLEIEVFSRYGDTVYKSLDYQDDWNGKGTGNLLGRDILDGTYYVAYKAIDVLTGRLINEGVKYITIRR